MEVTMPFVGNLDQIAASYFQVTALPREPVAKKLDRLAFTRDGIQSLEAQRKVIVDAALAGIHNLLDSIDAAIAELLTTAAETESEIKEEVLTGGATVKGTSLQAVFNRGRVSYDAKGLDALAVVKPEVLNFRKEGEPSVSIREVKH